MDGCVFCGIAAGVEEAEIVHQDEQVLAFLDIFPLNPGHLLVVPRLHAARLEGLPPDVGQRMFLIAQRAAAALYRSGVQCEGVTLMLADGPAAGQVIHHVHLHIIPRFGGDGIRLRHGNNANVRQGQQQLLALAEAIREVIG